MTLLIWLFVALFCLSGAFFITAFNYSLCEIPDKESEKLLNVLKKSFFYRAFHTFFGERDFKKALFFTTVCAQQFFYYFYGIGAFLFLWSLFPLFDSSYIENGLLIVAIILAVISFLIAGIYLGDVLPRILSGKNAEKALMVGAPMASLFMFIVFPITLLVLKLFPSFSSAIYVDHFQDTETPAQQEVLEIMQRADISNEISRHERQLIESVFNFRKRIVREVMVPRIETFALSADMTIRDAAKLLELEGYSRTPVYKETIDHIIGVLMYKDILKTFREYVESGNDPKVLDASIESITKPALYTPEMKKISNLLQEFRKQQVHLAIVIDEYGGTEGIVTIEDILEEIVGDIADEYDHEEELFKKQTDHSWIVDARLNIFDAEEQFDIKIPQDGEYDTLGGYIYHRAGTIPAKGFVIHHDDFEMEVVASSERAVEKVRIEKVPPQIY